MLLQLALVLSVEHVAVRSAGGGGGGGGGGGACQTELDCQLNGECVAGKCVCDPQWNGNANCSRLQLLPAKMDNGYGHVGSGTAMI